jgi:hypothetical protein
MINEGAQTSCLMLLSGVLAVLGGSLLAPVFGW